MVLLVSTECEVKEMKDSDTDEDEAEVYIMQEISDQDDQTVYEFVEDEAQLEALSKVFAELLDDVDIQM